MFPDLTRDDVFRIETRRMWLRWPCARDAQAIVELAGSREIAEMTANIPHPIDPVGIDSFIIAARRANTEGDGLTMALSARAAPAALIGVAGIGLDPHDRDPHLGFWLGRPHWGAGLTSEAVSAMVDAFFAYARGSVLRSVCLIENIASWHILEKLGFTHQGEASRALPARGGERRVHLFALSRERWSRLRLGHAQ